MTKGFCECGCGQRTKIATRTHSHYGYIKGQPVRFIRGHNKPSPEAREKLSEAQRGQLGHSWKGGRTKINGYIAVWISSEHSLAEMRMTDGRVVEHRLVMAEYLGRALSPGEIVHHMNGLRDDNRLENLELFETKAAHSLHHLRPGLATPAHYIWVRLPLDHPFAEMCRPDGNVREHRLVMAESLGRPLTPGEVVHHVNGDKTDNRLENLALFANSAAHTSHHRELGIAA